MRFRSRLALAAAVFALGLVPAAAQEITGTIFGTVTDQTGAVLPGVTVTVRNTGTGQSRQLVTTANGDYSAPLLQPGRYEIAFALSGFQATTAQGINLHVNDRLRVDTMLKTGTLEEVVEVTAGAQLIQNTPAVQSLMGSVQVQELPLNNRNFVQLATLVPGVTSDLGDEVGIGLTNVVSISVNGARRNAVNWLVDGAANVDVGSNVTLLATPTLESIEEFKIITSSYAAEWPRSGGGIINVVTKSGTNQFRGSIYEFFRNDALNANTFFRNFSTTPSIADKPPRLRYNNFGYTLGGPIKKDKLFFFWSQEWRKIRRVPATTTASVVNPAWLSDPSNPNYVAPEDRDPNAVRLLEAWPAGNLSAASFVNTAPSINDTRQEVIRADYLISDRWRLMGRYTHDLSTTEEFGGLFFGAVVPGVATTVTDVPGQVFVAQLTTTLNSNTLNEFSYQFSANDIGTTNPEGTRNKRGEFGFTGSELFPENTNDLIPIIRVTGALSTVGAFQPYNIEYRNHTVTDNLTLQRGSHSFKVGGLMTFEAKNENASNITQGDFTFNAGGGFTAFQNFLRGNRGGACGAACTYTESEIDVTNHLRFNRYEAYVQDSWKARPNVTIDAGLRYAVYPALTDENDLLSTFVPSMYDRSRAPQFANPTGGLVVVGTGDPLNGISVAGLTSPHGRAIYPTDKNNFMPRLGITWDPRSDSRTLLRAGFGVYYDQPLVGIFEQNAFTNPPYANSIVVENAALSNPGAGIPRTAVGLRTLQATSDPFDTPRTLQWNVGVQRQLWSKAAIDVGYVGSRGDDLIRPIEINQPHPADVVRLGGLNLARPYLGYGTITMRETSASNRYHGLLVNFRYDGGRNGLLNLAYTLSRNRTNSTNDRDAVDLPQDVQNLDAEWTLARTDRTHVFTANYVYELPFFRNSGGFRKAALGGWQVSGITTLQSGPPISRLEINSLAGTRGARVNQIGDPFANLPSDLYHINPAAFGPPAIGTYGNTGRGFFRLPGRNQWDLTLSKSWDTSSATRLQFRADFINAFNHTQFTTINRTCAASATDTSCLVPNSLFGRYDGVRAPREIQLALKFYWN